MLHLRELSLTLTSPPRPEDSEIEVKHLKHGELAVLETIWGHIGKMLPRVCEIIIYPMLTRWPQGGGGANEADTKWMDKKIADFLKT